MLLPAAFLLSVVLATQAPQGGSQPQRLDGKLVDAVKTNCKTTAENCPVSVTTTAFGLILAGDRYIKFDEGGNSKALEELKHSRKGSRTAFQYWRTGKPAGDVRASVTGTLTADTLNVESVRIP